MRYSSFPLVAASVAVLMTGCVATVTPPRVQVDVPAPEVYVPPPPRPVVSVYVEPPIAQPEPIAVGWAPPPLLVESPPPPPFDGAVWVGGYWVWQGDWVWAHGHWVGPPRPNYAWVHPYYENRDGVVIFITGHWSPPGVAFVPPPPGIHLVVEVAAPGVVVGVRPMGPNGCFVPAPPGSRAGIIIPAPVGTAPAVVTGAPPVVSVGMRVTANVSNTTIVNNRTVVNNTTNNVTNVRNVTNITNVTIVAPAGVTASGQAVNSTVPAQAHLAAAQPAVFKAQAPEPASTKPIPAFVHGRPPAPLPAAQAVSTNAAPMHANTNANPNGNKPSSPSGGPGGQGNQGRPGQGPNAQQGANSQQGANVANRGDHAGGEFGGGRNGAAGGNGPASGNGSGGGNGNGNHSGANGPGGNNPQVAANKQGNGQPGGQPGGAAGGNGVANNGGHNNGAGGGNRPQVANNGAGGDNKPPVANNGNKPGEGKHPNQGGPQAKDKQTTTAKNKADHPKKPANKDEHEKPT